MSMQDAMDGLREHLADKHACYVGPDGFTFEMLEMEHSGMHFGYGEHDHDYPRPTDGEDR